MMKALDTVDQRGIAKLESNGRAILAEISKVVGLSGQAVSVRMRRLQADGVIERFEYRDTKAARTIR